MTGVLHLNGRFWGPWIRQYYLAEIASLREAVLTRMLPVLPGPREAEREADLRADEAWAEAMSQSSDGSADYDRWAEWAHDQGMERYQYLSRQRQVVLNMGTVILWHLVEQQVLSFHRRQVLSKSEEHLALNDPRQFKELCTLREFQSRLAKGGVPLRQIPGWSKLDELRLVANTVKHGAGDSARRLQAVRPDLFAVPGMDDTDGWSIPAPERIERPAGGDDLYVTERDLGAYFDGAEGFWEKFSEFIEG